MSSLARLVRRISVALILAATAIAIQSSPAAAAEGKLCDPHCRVTSLDVMCWEGNFCVVPVEVLDVPAEGVTLRYRTMDGRAVTSADYEATAGSLTLRPEQPMVRLTVVTVGDREYEPDEDFSIVFTDDYDNVVGHIVVVLTEDRPPRS